MYEYKYIFKRTSLDIDGTSTDVDFTENASGRDIEKYLNHMSKEGWDLLTISLPHIIFRRPK